MTKQEGGGGEEKRKEGEKGKGGRKRKKVKEKKGEGERKEKKRKGKRKKRKETNPRAHRSTLGPPPKGGPLCSATKNLKYPPLECRWGYLNGFLLSLQAPAGGAQNFKKIMIFLLPLGHL